MPALPGAHTGLRHHEAAHLGTAFLLPGAYTGCRSGGALGT